MAAAGYTSPVEMDYYVLPWADGVVDEEEQLVVDSLTAAGTSS